MSAIEETTATVPVLGTGKDTGDGTQPSAGGVHPAQPFPHLPYGDALHAELTSVGLAPDVMEAGVRAEGRYGEGPQELFLRAEWLPGHEDLAAPHKVGVVLQWSHLTGWSLLFGDDLVVLDVDDLAAPALLTDAVLEGAVHGVSMRYLPPEDAARWEHALALDTALTHLAEPVGGPR
ncbi:hypothetical protein OIE43_18955 [Streptomyces pseudovenezuelae]|uniref:hypothetical protein n=1 Tax=Streptomyces pseudovenezuelae TaxID=67350 RepID=UPI002E346557|nr:hypothetical protein [Streptomyces pseudovenezuelae]